MRHLGLARRVNEISQIGMEGFVVQNLKEPLFAFFEDAFILDVGLFNFLAIVFYFSAKFRRNVAFEGPELLSLYFAKSIEIPQDLLMLGAPTLPSGVAIRKPRGFDWWKDRKTPGSRCRAPELSASAGTH